MAVMLEYSIHTMVWITLAGSGAFLVGRHELNQLQKETEPSRQEIARAMAGLRATPAE
jgi:hypothetical protein